MSISFLPIISYLSTLCTSLLLLLLSPSPSPELKLYNETASLFIFGDSMVDAGNNNYINTTFRGNRIPYGESFFAYPTGRCSDGLLIPDFIGAYMGLPLIHPYLQPNFTFDGGANFASAGAGALAETDSEFNIISLEGQLQNLEELADVLKEQLGDEKANATMANAIYFIYIGGADIMSLYSSSTDLSYEGIVTMVIGNVTTAINSIYDRGGRKFMFSALLPLGCTPSNRLSNGTCEAELNVLARMYNANLSEALEELETQRDGFKYSIFDFYDTLLQRINHPSVFGLENGVDACCGLATGGCADQTVLLCEDPSKYTFFDCNHPTQAVYKQLAYLIWNGTDDVIRPRNLQSLFNA